MFRKCNWNYHEVKMLAILYILGRHIQSNVVFSFLVRSFPCSAKYFPAPKIFSCWCQNVHFWLVQKLIKYILLYILWKYGLVIRSCPQTALYVTLLTIKKHWNKLFFSGFNSKFWDPSIHQSPPFFGKDIQLSYSLTLTSFRKTLNCGMANQKLFE